MKSNPISPARAARISGLCLMLTLTPQWGAAETVPLTTLDLSMVQQGWGRPQVDRGIREKPLSIGGKAHAHGLGTHAKSTMWIDLAGGSERFQATVGVDDAAGAVGSVSFKVYGDHRLLFNSGVMKWQQPGRPVDVDVRGVRTLFLLVEDGGDGTGYDHADWAEARLVVNGPTPKSVPGPSEEPIVLTPKPGPVPKINGPTLYGCRPGHPFLYRIPATGVRPIAFSATGLPAGLTLDPQSGIITGTTPARGEYEVTLRARNAKGSDRKPFRIVSGDTLALTPPMGWNHWYAHYDRVTDKMMREAADHMVASGMADVGYQYVNIDDCWMMAAENKDPLRKGPLRAADGVLIPNKHFPDMTGLTAYIHAKGLKAGIYTSPGPTTCAGFAGAYQHEAQDAKTFADWGFDFLKYDWCSYGDVVKGDTRLETFQKPYRQMGALLREQPRDIVFNLCQYGMGDVWKWGEEVGGHCWRTAGDLGFELNRIFEVALQNATHREHSRPGAWNDPDYLQIGKIGDASTMGGLKPCPLTPNEQYAFMSLWCLMAAPLVYSGDMNSLDEFTLNVLCNPEVIEVDQDPLGQCARTVLLGEETFVMVKTMADGSKAVGLANRGEFPQKVAARWGDLGIQGRQRARDLWRQRDLGTFDREFEVTVPRHAVTLIRLWPKR